MQNQDGKESANEQVTDLQTPAPVTKKPYRVPQLHKFGSVQMLTQNSGSKGSDNKSKKTSDSRLKTNIVRIGTHPLGFGLYLFDYQPGFADLPRGRQFGVMAQEVESLVPEAVSVDTDGYRRVDYHQLGIVLH